MEVIFAVLAGLIVGLILITLITLVFRWLWNTTMPEVFDLKTLSFGQALKIMILSGMLFGGTTRVIESGHEVVLDDDNPVLSTSLVSSKTR